MWGLGCGVWGVGCGVWGVGCGVWGEDPTRAVPELNIVNVMTVSCNVRLGFKDEGQG